MADVCFNGNGFADAVIAAVSRTIQGDVESLEEDIRQAGDDCNEELHQTSKQRTGVYAKGWVSDVKGGGYETEARVHNVNKAWLTHLLENGHEQFYMGHDLGYRTPGDKAIETAYDNAARRLMDIQVDNP